MENLRIYGNAPYQVVVVHGGPGAAGEMAPIARELALDSGIWEPRQTATSLAGQIDELKTVLEGNRDLPVTLIGFSWGAWLSWLTAANSPALVKKLILIGSGPFEAKYAATILETRLNRLSEKERAEVKLRMEFLSDPTGDDKNTALVRLGALFSQADAFDPISNISEETDAVECRADIFHNVWQTAAELRSSGKLLECGSRIQCPVVVIHGDYDPHPYEGVEKPLAAVLKDFKFILLNNCGHKPWIERQARKQFYDILKAELR